MATLPTETPVTALRQRMLDDMAMRSMRSRTQHDYVRHVRAFAAFLKRSPDTATAEDVRRFQLHQREHGVEESVIGAWCRRCASCRGVDRRRTRDPTAGHTNISNRSKNMVQGGVLIGADPDPGYVKLQRKFKDLVRVYRARTLDADLQSGSTPSSLRIHRSMGSGPLLWFRPRFGDIRPELS